MVLAGTALGTGPIPRKEASVAPENMTLAFVRDEVFEKNNEIPEKCTPRPVVLCAGPYDPDIDFQFGNTGVLVNWSDVNATVGHDPSRHWDYGPYTVYAVLDDARLCESGCKIPNSVYGELRGNVTVVVYYLGKDVTLTVPLGYREFGLEEPGVLAPTCRLTAWYDCTTLT